MTNGLWKEWIMAEMTFNGQSQELSQTQILPTLHTPVRQDSNVVWCASLLSAWKVLQKDIAGEPLELEGANDDCALLNEADDPEDSVPAGALYSAAGRVQKGIIDTIHDTVQKKFPTNEPPSFPGIAADSFLAYAYLEANVSFELPYFQNREPFVFTDGTGHETMVNSFGIRPEDEYAYFNLRNQPAILYTKRDAHYELQEFGVDLCRNSEPSQIVLARTELRKTLMETISAFQEKIEPGQNHEGLDANDVLLVPDLFWQVSHNFGEFEGRLFKNEKLKGQAMDVMMQDILFRLDRSGAELKSEAKQYCLPIPSHYLFDRPFLIYMKKRNAQFPYFAMWVGNAELLQPWKEE